MLAEQFNREKRSPTKPAKPAGTLPPAKAFPNPKFLRGNVPAGGSHPEPQKPQKPSETTQRSQVVGLPSVTEKFSNEPVFLTDQPNLPETKKPDYLAHFLNQTFETHRIRLTRSHLLFSNLKPKFCPDQHFFLN